MDEVTPAVSKLPAVPKGPATGMPAAKSALFRIWSNKHQAWWRPGGWGYTNEIAAAGWFTPEETLRHLYGSACGSLPGKPNEVAVDGSGLRFVLELQREADEAVSGNGA